MSVVQGKSDLPLKNPKPGFVKAYAHNGHFKSLKDIVRFYNTGTFFFSNSYEISVELTGCISTSH